jgi:hypothetical protein
LQTKIYIPILNIKMIFRKIKQVIFYLKNIEFIVSMGNKKLGNFGNKNV